MGEQMVLGGYTFDYNPSKNKPPKLVTKVRRVAAVETIESVTVFSWGLTYAGQTVRLLWEWLPDSQFRQLEAIWDADAAVVFDPKDDSGKTFNVELMNFSGTAGFDPGVGLTCIWRRDVVVDLLVLSEVS